MQNTAITKLISQRRRYTIDWTNPQNDPLLQEAAALEQHDNEVRMNDPACFYWHIVLTLLLEHDGPIIWVDVKYEFVVLYIYDIIQRRWYTTLFIIGRSVYNADDCGQDEHSEEAEPLEQQAM